MGRPSAGYTSSQESLKVPKKAKNMEDIFGLDEILGLNDSQLDKVVDGPRINYIEKGNGPLDLNDHPVGSEVTLEDADNCEHDVTVPATILEEEEEGIQLLRQEEINRTVNLGGKLGADLEAYTDMVQESIIKEGLQRGNQ